MQKSLKYSNKAPSNLYALRQEYKNYEHTSFNAGATEEHNLTKFLMCLSCITLLMFVEDIIEPVAVSICDQI